MKYIILLFIFIFISIYSKSNTTIVYIDVSKSSNKEKIIKQTKYLVNKNISDDFIVFISNDNTPIIITNINSLDKKLNELFYITPSSPFIDDEVDTLNYYMDNFKLSVNSNNNIDFFFFSPPSDKTNILITKLLLSNRLSNKDGLKKNIKVSILYEEEKETYETKKYYELFKQKKYEIKYY